MNKTLKSIALFVIVISVLVVLISCNETKINSTNADNNIAKVENNNTKPLKLAETLSKEFNDYWYSGEAEISSFKFEQARYGEMRQGTAVLVYVTEDFLPEQQVKADTYDKNNTKVLKLNATKNFNTGIYPYSIMQSTFYPVANNQHAVKISASIQEWCGQVYAQLNNRSNFEVTAHSYFQSEGDQNLSLEKTVTENEIWTQLRINPQSLPTGDFMVLPSLEFIRLKHQKFKALKANATLGNNTYNLYYPELDRTLSITFNSNFPYYIVSWEDTYRDGYGPYAKKLTTKATRIKTIKSAYWGKNSNADEGLRAELGLE